MTYYSRSPGVAGRVVDGEAVLIRARDARLFVLNGAGARIWVGADGTRTSDDLADGAPREAVEAFLAEMAGEGLVTAGDAPAARAAAFPQEVSLPRAATGAPAIVASELVDVMGGTSCPVSKATELMGCLLE